MSPDAASGLSASTTGFVPWWTYIPHAIPGVGAAYANVNTGNALVSVTDVDVHEAGLDLSLTRVWNSMSQHDAGDTDGTTPSVWGNGWTSNLDAHISNPTGTDISVYDGTGARFDYQCPTIGASGICTNLTAGDYNTLNLDPNNPCNYSWTMKSGVVYEFYSPAPDPSCNLGPAYDGRLAAIYGRNANTSLTLTYSWQYGTGDDPENLTQIEVAHSGTDGTPSGQVMTLNFGSNMGAHPRELTNVQLPDGRQLSYSYDAVGTLLEVDHPGNNSAGTLPETYALHPVGIDDKPTSPSEYEYACSPRYSLGAVNNGTSNDGGCLKFGFDSSGRISQWFDAGIVNFTPGTIDGMAGDGADVLLQPDQSSYTGWQQLSQTWFYYGAVPLANCNFTTSGRTAVCDSDNHSVAYDLNSQGNVWRTSTYTGSLWLVATQSWDANNNITSTTDTNGNETDYAYDHNGNLVEIGQPTISISGTSYRPTILLSYDGNNNLIASCDPIKTNSVPGGNWPASGTPNPGSTPCPQQSGATRLSWNSTTADPDGELSTVTKPGGYVWTIGYNGSEGASVDLGLPTSLKGGATGDGSRAPSYTFGYDAYGDVTTFNPGNGHAWTIGYDSSNRLESISDPNSDNTFVCYYGDNTIKYTETPHQNTLDGNPNACLSTIPTYAVSYKRDPDGNAVTETHHHGGVYNSNPLPTKANVTTRYYDGLDRLVEVLLPGDPSDVLSTPWITRYIYDLTQGESLGTANFAKPSTALPSGFAYGNLFKIQEYLPGANSSTTPTNPLVYAAPSSTPAPGQPFIVPSQNQIGGVAGFADVKGVAYDGANRPTSIYTRVTSNGTPNTLATETLHYDNNGYSPSTGGLVATYSGLLDHVCNANNQCEYFAYDARNMLTNVHDTDSINVASRVIVYDLDGRVSGTAGGDTYSASVGYRYTYTPDSLIATEQEPSGLSETALFTHNYYNDGLEKSLDVASSVLTQVGLFKYSYDGAGAIDSYIANFSNVSSAANAGVATVTYGYNNSEMQDSISVNTPGSSGMKTFATSMTYSDALVSSVTYPTATYPSSATNVINNMQYNAEGELLGYNGTDSNRATYSSRGELEQGNAFANGLEIPGNEQTKWDPLMGAPVKEGTGPACPTSLTATPPPMSCWTYDNGGRMTQETLPSGINMASTITLKRTYDAENRLVSTSSQNAYPPTLSQIQTQTPAPLTNVQNWGPIDEPNRLGGVNPLYPGPVKQDTLHWSSDGLIFTTKPSGLVDDLKLGTLGDVMPLDPSKPGVSNGATYYERGPDSSIGGCYNANQTEPFTTYPAFGQSTFGFGQLVSQDVEPIQPCQLNAPAAMPTNIIGSAFIGSFANYPPIGGTQNGIIGMFRTDGISNGTDIIQGVRAYDPNSGTWTTPDQFGGFAGNPISEKSYAWTNNNPISNLDPTGYFTLSSPGQGGYYCAGGDNDGTLVATPDGCEEAFLTEEYGDFTPLLTGPDLRLGLMFVCHSENFLQISGSAGIAGSVTVNGTGQFYGAIGAGGSTTGASGAFGIGHVNVWPNSQPQNFYTGWTTSVEGGYWAGLGGASNPPPGSTLYSGHGGNATLFTIGPPGASASATYGAPLGQIPGMAALCAKH